MATRMLGNAEYVGYVVEIGRHPYARKRKIRRIFRGAWTVVRVHAGKHGFKNVRRGFSTSLKYQSRIIDNTVTPRGSEAY
jgi:hypothetical protein